MMNIVIIATIVISIGSPIMSAHISATMPPIIEERDTYWVINRLIKNTTTTTANINGTNARTTPAEVATALPPLKPANIGYI